MKQNLALFRRSLELIDKELKIRLAALAFVALLISGLDALGVLLMLPLVKIVDGGGGSVDLPLFDSVGPVALLAMVVGLFISKSVATAVLRWWTLGVTLRSGSRASSKMFERYMSSSVEFHDSRNSADAVRTIVVSVRNFFHQGVIGATNLIAESITLIVLSLILLSQSPVAGLITFGYFGLAVFVFSRYVQRSTTEHSTTAQNLTGDSIRLIQEGLGALTELRVRDTTCYVTDPFEQKQSVVQQVRRVIMFSGELARYYLEIVFVGAVGLVGGAVFILSPSGEVLPTLALFLVIGFRTLPSLSRLLLAANNIRIGWSALGIVCEDLDAMETSRTPEVDVEQPGVVSDPVSIRLNGLGFSYGKEPVLRDVSLELAAGESMGLLGASGSGKSTLLEIICGLRLPTAGTIEVGSERLEDGQRPVVGYVPQNVFAIDSTIFENVTLGREASEDEVWEALEIACAADFVREFPEGLNTPVGESGSLLSGGQRQRLGLARACLIKPGLLILDEATSALDSETEALVVRSLERLRGATTLVLVTHRSSTLKFCDRVLQVSEGKVTDATVEFERQGVVSLQESSRGRKVS